MQRQSRFPRTSTWTESSLLQVSSSETDGTLLPRLVPRCLRRRLWLQMHKMAVFVFRMFGLHFWMFGESRDAWSVFHYSPWLHVHFLTLSSDPGATLCHQSLSPPTRGSLQKAQCEISPFLHQPSTLKWAAPLTVTGFSPVYLQADWFSAALLGLDKQLILSSIMRPPTATKESNGNTEQNVYHT